MKKITTTAPAKVNLCIDILKKEPNGYHQIQTLLCICENFKDSITIFETKETDNVSIINTPENHLIKMEENLAFKALKLIKETYKIDQNISIKLTKNIPISAGLGGGSSDAASVLTALNQLWELHLTTQTLMELGAKLGMDVPFFILGGTALGTNYGEQLTPLPHLKDLKFEIQIPSSATNKQDESRSQLQPPQPQTHHTQTAQATAKTADMYAKLDLSKCGKNTEKTKAFIEAIKNNDLNKIKENLHNDFETIIQVPEGWHLSGSGTAIFKI